MFRLWVFVVLREVLNGKTPAVRFRHVPILKSSLSSFGPQTRIMPSAASF